MKRSARLSGYVVNSICFLYILLFVYAAVTKLLDFQQFKFQLEQSPILSFYSPLLAWLIPLAELTIVVMLFIERSRLAAFILALSLMTMFTAYIFIILNFSNYIPCSCGGVLERMSWTEHFIFNISFLILAILGIVIVWKKNNLFIKKHDKIYNSFLFNFYSKKPWPLIISILIASAAVLSIFHLLARKHFQTDNSFVRKFLDKPMLKIRQMDLGFNSYYFAGEDGKGIFLGNHTAPLHAVFIDTLKWEKHTIEISLDRDSIQSRSTQLRISPECFFLLDGTVPFVFKGSITNWKAKELPGKGFYYSMIQPLNCNHLAIRGVSSISSKNILGVVDLDQNHKLSLSENLIEKQVDGVFDTDGLLQYNSQLKKIIYTYFYRNEFVVANENLTLFFRGNTIDTISQVKLKVANINSKKQVKMVKRPLLVNKYSATYGDYLFVNSNIPGRYESQNSWSINSIIDVYSLVRNKYQFSFKIPDLNSEKLSSFVVFGPIFYGLFEDKLVVYRFNSKVFESI